ncbi:hypothetical protein WJX72_006534 [[Myrmecia] bisecta]|uniref:RING-type domain-containing protein n=1 Tax=[Myrmecia] bisecta TaxID=41462 RepID=A0AAW1Q458_9CHLO
MLTMIGAQSGLFWWKKKHKRSYELVTLLGLWLVPFVISVYLHFWRFVLVWSLFTSTTLYMLHLCTAKKMDSRTPGKVYAWFLGLYKLSVFVGAAGYVLLVLEMTGIGMLLRPVLPQTTAVLLVWYGLYFGVLGRDAAEVASDRMASSLGTGRRMAVSVRSCGICGTDLEDFHQVGQPSSSRSGSVQLACKHLFHEQCIRGWTIVGKKDTCPTCLEKVDLRDLYANRPWETTNLTWIQMLDAVRYMVVWNPIILMALHFALSALGIEQSHHANNQVLMAGTQTLLALNSTGGIGNQTLLNATLVSSQI